MLKLFLSGNWVKQYQIENLRQLFNFKQFSNVFLQKHSIKCFGSVFTIVVVLNWVVLWSWRVEKSGLLLYILRYESSILILYKKLSSSIFQSLSVSKSSVTARGHFAPRTFCPTELLPQGHFAPGHFAPTFVKIVDILPHFFCIFLWHISSISWA